MSEAGIQQAARRRPKFRTIFWIATAVLTGALLALAFRPRPVPVDMAEVVRGPMHVTVQDEGRTRVRNEYVVSAPVAGRLLRVPFKPGAKVEAGEIVARIEPSEPAFLDARTQAEARAAADAAKAALAAAEAQLEQARAQVRFARSELERVEGLRERKLTSQQSVDRARLDFEVAQSGLASAEQGARQRRAEEAAARARLAQPGGPADAPVTVAVTAPVTGSVLRVAQESETVVPAGAEIMSLGDPHDLEIVVEMLTTDAVQVRAGDKVIIDNFGRSETPLQGRVRLVEPYGFKKISALGVEEQRVNVIVDFTGPAEEWAELGHGYRVEAAIVTWAESDVLQVPVAALFRSEGSWAVFRIEKGRVRLTRIDLGRQNGEDAQVVDGLEPGQRVVLYPGEDISDGMRVERRGS